MSELIRYIMNKEHVLNIGFDDTDSPTGMCTTFLAYKIVDLLQKQKTEFLDFPKLIRFNPNIPWKTRGNGAVSLKIKTRNPSKIKNQIKNLVFKYSDTKNGANPGLVFFESDSIPSEFTKFSNLALWQLINRNSAKKFIQKNNLDFFYEGNGQGLVGAISANAVKILKLLGYDSITDVELDKNPNLISEYNKIIILHNEYVTKKMFNAITSHPNVIYLYPNALYAEIDVNYEKNEITLIRGHNYPESEILNGFNWEFENTPYEYDKKCENWEFYDIPNGKMLNCYPEQKIWQDKDLLKMLKEF